MSGIARQVDPDVTAVICRAVREGCVLSVALKVAGVSWSVHHRWVRRGEERPGTPEAEYAEAVDRAMGEREQALTTKIAGAADTDWRAAAWLLERTVPERYAARTHHTVDATVGVRESQQAALAELTDDQVRDLRDYIENAERRRLPDQAGPDGLPRLRPMDDAGLPRRLASSGDRGET